MKKAVLLGIFFVLFALSANALTFEASLKPVNNHINLGESASFILTLRNDLPTIENFVIYSTEVLWSLSAESPSDRNPKVYSESSTTVKLRIKPTTYVTPGLYSFPVTVRNTRTNELRTVPAVIEILSKEPFPGKYLPGIRSTAEIASEVDPRSEVGIRVDLVNQNPLNITDLVIVLRSNLIHKEYTTSLEPFETKTVNFNIKLDPLIPPQDDILYTTIKIDRHALEPEPKPFKILDYGDIKVTKDTKKVLFKSTLVITLENTGNSVKKGVVREPYGIIGGMFMGSQPKGAKVVFDGRKQLAWQAELEPGKSIEIVVVANYQYLVTSIAIVLIIIACYFVFRSPVVLRKAAMIIGRKHGGISGLSVRITVINRGKFNSTDVVITDKLPNLVDLEKEFEEGTLRPSSILKHEKKGTLIKWQIRTLEPGEERIIHYKVKTRLSILGSLTLPVTVVRFKYSGMKAERVTASNRLIVRA